MNLLAKFLFHEENQQGDLRVLKSRFRWHHLIPTQDKNQPKAGFCPSGFINFALPKNLCTYQVISNITYGVVNFPKIGAKSSNSKGTFFRRLAVLFLPASCTFFVPSKNSIKNLSFFAFKHRIWGGQLPKNRCEIL